MRFYLDTKQVIQKRKIYGVMDFLADSGGVYGSLYLLGSFLHFLVSQDALSIKLLEGHFKIIKAKHSRKVQQILYTASGQNGIKSASKRRVKLGCMEHLIYGTCLRALLCNFAPSRCCRRDKEKLRLLEKAQKVSDRALDLRTTLKI